MEKLIQLLNERDAKDGSKRKRYFVPNRICWEGCDNSECSDLLIISEKFGFIKRLVENDKIDRERILKENGQFRLFYYDLERVKNYDRLVMYLSVEDSPIEFLISILK